MLWCNSCIITHLYKLRVQNQATKNTLLKWQNNTKMLLKIRDHLELIWSNKLLMSCLRYQHSLRTCLQSLYKATLKLLSCENRILCQSRALKLKLKTLVMNMIDLNKVIIIWTARTKMAPLNNSSKDQLQINCPNIKVGNLVQSITS